MLWLFDTGNHPSSVSASPRHLLPQREKEEPLHCHANHHGSRLTEALLSRLSFSPLWEKVAEPERSAGEVG